MQIVLSVEVLVHAVDVVEVKKY